MLDGGLGKLQKKMRGRFNDMVSLVRLGAWRIQKLTLAVDTGGRLLEL